MRKKSPIGRIKFRTKREKYSVKKAWKRLKRWSEENLP
jgi:hypothetical protein